MSNTINIGNTSDEFYRYKMPRLVAKVEGRGNGIKTVIVNMAEIAQALSRPPTWPLKYFGFELGAQAKFDKKNDRYIVNGNHDAKTLQDTLQDGFIKKFVLCGRCSNPETITKVDKNENVTLECKACGATTEVDRREKFYQFIVREQSDTKAPAKRKKEKKKEGDEGADEEAPETPTEAPAEQSPVDVLKGFVNVKGEPSDSELLQALAKLQKDYEFGERETTCLLCEGILDKDPLTMVLNRTAVIQKVVGKEKAQLTLLGYLETFSARDPKVMAALPRLIFHLYENDVLEEEVIKEWHKKKKSKFCGSSDAKKIREIVNPIINWFETADVE